MKNLTLDETAILEVYQKLTNEQKRAFIKYLKALLKEQEKGDNA